MNDPTTEFVAALDTAAIYARLEQAKDRERLLVPILFECVLAPHEIVAVRGAARGGNE